MRKTYKHRFFSLLIGFTLILFLASCVDTSVENIPQGINYMSKIRIVNNVPGVDATCTVDGASIGNVQSGATSNYVDAPSGSRTVVADYSSDPDVQATVILDTEKKITVTVVEDTVSGTVVRSFVKTVDGYIWE